MSWSNRPGRKMAESMMSGLLVAPMMKTFFLELIPSISVRTWLMTRSAAPPGEEGKGRHPPSRDYHMTRPVPRNVATTDLRLPRSHHETWQWSQVHRRREHRVQLAGPCQRRLVHWPLTPQTTSSIAQGPT